MTVHLLLYRAALTCVPNGFVRTTTSPARAPSLGTYSPAEQMVVATPPMTGQGFSTVCPPVTVVPASKHASLNPRTCEEADRDGEERVQR